MFSIGVASPPRNSVSSATLTRSLLLAFADVQRRIGAWHGGEVWLYLSGHGTIHVTTATEARPGLLFTSTLHPSPEDQMLWEEVFAALQVPTALDSTLLPDPDTTTLLAGRVPGNVVALVMKAGPGAELACRARSYRFEHQGRVQERGVISYDALQTLAQATTSTAWFRV